MPKLKMFQQVEPFKRSASFDTGRYGYSPKGIGVAMVGLLEGILLRNETAGRRLFDELRVECTYIRRVKSHQTREHMGTLPTGR